MLEGDHYGNKRKSRTGQPRAGGAFAILGVVVTVILIEKVTFKQRHQEEEVNHVDISGENL